MGYSREHLSQLEDLLGSAPLDFRLLSFHAYRERDYIESDAHAGLSDEDYAAAYFDMALEGVETLGQQVQVLAHLDYPFRYRPRLGSERLWERFQELIGAIVRSCARQGMAIELNTKSMYRFGREDFYGRLLGLIAQETSPEQPIKLCLGSDCHRAQDWHANFERALALVHSYGLEPSPISRLLGA
ncbi:hypothetical protein KIM372_15430 [Bombiscardovia nodaiensis]|uniref:Histidinol-phosphatase n=1 Tax=Bombiscardovia nodaiensis TaxID=2932181 RepID=A0ABM8B9R5_9BIFI|nr:hypothetical protein KIM372_15430 [Bombiscardovia nodaiensis]